MAVEAEQSRGAEQQCLDVARHGSFAQDHGIGSPPCQIEVGPLIAFVAQRAEEHQVEGLVPVALGLFEEFLDRGNLAAQAVVGRILENLAAVQRVQLREVLPAGECSGAGLQPVEHPFVAVLHRLRTC